MKRRLDMLAKFFATGLGVGYIPLAPGTFGSLWGCALFFVLRYQLGFGQEDFARVTLVLTLAAIPIAHRAETAFGAKDPGRIVIDELVGQLICYLFVPYSNFNLLLGFVLFRLLDVAKIFPARLAQDRLKGGLGVVGDDVVAGLQGALILHFFPAGLRVVDRCADWARGIAM